MDLGLLQDLSPFEIFIITSSITIKLSLLTFVGIVDIHLTTSVNLITYWYQYFSHNSNTSQTSLIKHFITRFNIYRLSLLRVCPFSFISSEEFGTEHTSLHSPTPPFQPKGRSSLLWSSKDISSFRLYLPKRSRTYVRSYLFFSGNLSKGILLK